MRLAQSRVELLDLRGQLSFAGRRPVPGASLKHLPSPGQELVTPPRHRHRRRLIQPPAGSYDGRMAVTHEEPCEQPPVATQTSWETSPAVNLGLAVLCVAFVPFGVIELITEQGFARFRTIGGGVMPAMSILCASGYFSGRWRQLAERHRARNTPG